MKLQTVEGIFISSNMDTSHFLAVFYIIFHQCMNPTETCQYISVTVPLFISSHLICLLFFLLALKENSLPQDATFCHDKRPPQWMRPLFVCPEKRRVLSRSIQSGCIVLKPFRPSALRLVNAENLVVSRMCRHV